MSHYRNCDKFSLMTAKKIFSMNINLFYATECNSLR